MVLSEIAEYLEEYDGTDSDGNHSLKWCAMKEAEAVIQKQPIADVREVVHGEWIYGEEPIIGNPYGHYDCSVCKERVPFEENYCPYCGAKMQQKPSEVEENE